MLVVSFLRCGIPDRTHANDQRRGWSETNVIAIQPPLWDAEIAERHLNLDRLLRIAKVSACEAEVSAKRAHDRREERRFASGVLSDQEERPPVYIEGKVLKTTEVPDD